MNDQTEVYRTNFYFIAPGQKFHVSQTSTLGRKGTDIVIKDSQLSSNHCRFVVKGIQVILIDLGSTNGSFVNGKQIDANVEVPLNLGDRIQLGSFEYVLKNKDEDVKLLELKSVFEPKMLLNFFEAKTIWMVTYICSIALSAAIVFVGMEHFRALPPMLRFFHAILSKDRTQCLIVVILFSLLCSYFHAYLSRFYFKKSGMMSFLSYVGVLSAQVLFLVMALGYFDRSFKDYIRARDLVVRPQEKAEKLQAFKNYNIQYNEQYKRLDPESQQKLDKDYAFLLDHANK